MRKEVLVCSPQEASALVGESVGRHTNLLLVLGGAMLAGVVTIVATIFVYPDEVATATTRLGNAIFAILGG